MKKASQLNKFKNSYTVSKLQSMQTPSMYINLFLSLVFCSKSFALTTVRWNICALNIGDNTYQSLEYSRWLLANLSLFKCLHKPKIQTPVKIQTVE